jgi:hypothetical protein
VIHSRSKLFHVVTPAKAGAQLSPFASLFNQVRSNGESWVPACAGMTTSLRFATRVDA